MKLDNPNYYDPITSDYSAYLLRLLGVSPSESSTLECYQVQAKLERRGLSLWELQALKYIWRADRKGSELSDYRKAMRYLNLKDPRTIAQKILAFTSRPRIEKIFLIDAIGERILELELNG